jgi:hypothetical protein
VKYKEGDKEKKLQTGFKSPVYSLCLMNNLIHLLPNKSHLKVGSTSKNSLTIINDNNNNNNCASSLKKITVQVSIKKYVSVSITQLVGTLHIIRRDRGSNSGTPTL